MRILNSNPNVDNSDLVNYPNGRIKNNDGSGNGTAVNERVYGDIHQAVSKLMRLYGITPNDLPDNETNGFQIIDALRSLASKNDFVLPLSLSGSVLQVPIKIALMLENESVVCKSGFDFASQTQIKGSDAPIFTVSVLGNFKSNEYVRLIKTSSGVTIVRLADNVSLDDMTFVLNYLKKANQTQENAGLLDTVATTPLTNLTAFIRRVIGVDSEDYLATASRNGLYPKEHFSIVAALGANPVRNIGTVSGIDIAGPPIGGTFPVSGNISSATLTAITSGGSTIRVVLQNTMTDSNYYVRSFIQGQSSTLSTDGNIGNLIFKPINATTFDFFIREFVGGVQNLKIHFEVVKI
jgi:hypothetical protein